MGCAVVALLMSAAGCQEQDVATERGFSKVDVATDEPTPAWTEVRVPQSGVAMQCPRTWCWREPDILLNWMIVAMPASSGMTKFRVPFNYADLRIFDTLSARTLRVDAYAEVFVHPSRGSALGAVRKAAEKRYSIEQAFALDDEPVSTPIGPMIRLVYTADRKAITGKTVRFAVERYLAATEDCVVDIGFWAPLRQLEDYQETFDRMIASFRILTPDPAGALVLPEGPTLPKNRVRAVPIVDEIKNRDLLNL